MMKKFGSVFGRNAVLGMASSLAIAAAIPAAHAQPKAAAAEIAIDRQPLSDALVSISAVYGVSVFGDETLIAGKQANRVEGTLTVENALATALGGSGLSARQSQAGGFVLVAAQEPDGPISTAPPPQIEGDDVAAIQDVVTVTGSRIERTNANAPSPIDVVSAEDIAVTGLTDVTEALRFVPALQQSISLTTPELGGRTSFSAGAEGTAGLARLNLRGLGEERTLVLVNGRRHVGGVTGLPTVDVTSIPQALIERIEVLTGGGSSIYGADAVSGVVNYIIKDDFEGVEFAGNYSLPTQGDSEGYFGSVTLGGNFGEGRGNAVVNAEYQFQNNLQTQDRSFTEVSSLAAGNTPELAAFLGISPDFVNVIVPNRRGPFNPRAGIASVTFLGDEGAAINAFRGGMTEIGGIPVLQTVDRTTGAITPFDFGIPTAQNFFQLGGDGGTVFGFAPQADTIPETERFSVNAFADYDITPWLNTFGEVKYTRNESRSRVLFTLNLGDVPISDDNPFIPELIREQAASLDAQGIERNLIVDNLLSDDNTDLPREAVRETFRAVGGFRGEVSEALNYELSFNYGRTDTLLANNGEPLPDRFFAAADAIADPVTGEPICRSDIDPDTPFPFASFPRPAIPGFNTFAPGDGTCSPINFFGPISDEAAEFFLVRTEQTFELEQFVINGVITGNSDEYFQLPAGGVGYAAGFEYRDEQSQYRPDPLQIANLGFLSAFADDVPIAGGFDVTEGFAEVNIPVLADLPYVEQLDLDASIRFSDYSSVGNTTAFAVGGVWQPISDLRLRASFNRAVRAPNIGELFTPQATVPGQTDDPCSATNINLGTSTRVANCNALIGDIPNFDGSLSIEGGSVQQTRGGNPDLIEETADTLTIGFAYRPSFIPGLTLVADYYDIDIEDGITGAPTDETIAANCVDAQSLNNPFCDAVTRDPTTGTIIAVQSTSLNLAAIRGEGIDYEANYVFDLDDYFQRPLGDFTASIAGTWLLAREDVPFADFPESIDIIDQEIGFPEHFFNFGLAWEQGPFSADYGFNFQSSQFLTSPFPRIERETIEADPLLLFEPKTGSSFVHYIGGTYNFRDTVDFSVRVNNLTDREPFFGAPQFQRFQPVSAIGRTIQFGVRARF